MYLDYFGLDRDPFTISPDPAFLYPSPQHRQALAHLKYGLDRAGGFILLTGEVGTGKTTLTRLLLEQLAGNVRVAYILNAKLNSRDVLASICQELGLSNLDSDLSIKALTDQINIDLLAAHTQGKKTLVVIEEAQNLEPDVLETLRLLTNLETNTTKLLHILLVGQPELLDLIARNELRQLNQRVVSRFHIDPLSQEETKHYLAHRLRRASCKRQVFDDAAIKQLHHISGGIPRIINLIAERSLLGAYATGEQKVSGALVRTASKEVFGDTEAFAKNYKKNQNPNKTKAGLWLYSVSILVIVFLVLLYILGDSGGVSGSRDPLITEYFDSIESENTGSLDNSAGSTGNNDQNESLLANSQVSEEDALGGTIERAIEANESKGVNSDISNVSREIDQNFPVKNAYERLLSIWGVDAEAPSQSLLCEIASRSDLNCQIDEGLQLNELFEINRPSLVTLQISEESSVQYLLVSLTEKTAYLENSSGRHVIAIDQFENQWSKTASYLWRPPFNYSGLLFLMKKDTQAVAWIQQQLGLIYPDYEYIIGGGFYSQAIANVVAKFQAEQGLQSDGLIGPRTILRMMDQSEDLPNLMPTHINEQRLSPVNQSLSNPATLEIDASQIEVQI